MTNAPDDAWTDDLLRDPHAVADKRSRVQRMFAAIAPAYDRNNRLHSLGQDQRWRRRAVKLSHLKAEEFVVDVACGTGDLTMCYAIELAGLDGARKLAAGQTVGVPQDHRVPLRALGIDYTFEMLKPAVGKDEALTERVDDPTDIVVWTGSTAWLNADATALPLADASADVVSIAFGIRNVQEPLKALAEFHRVLRPGGRVIVLEFSQPTNPIIRFCNDLYCKRIMPHTATWLSGDRTGAYKYLPMSVATFMSRTQMSQSLRDVGFIDVTEHPMTFGVAVIYRGYKQ